MKYFRSVKKSMRLPQRIVLDDCILNIYFNEDGDVVFMEACDDFFHETFDANEAIELLQEAIDWIKDQYVKQSTLTYE